MNEEEIKKLKRTAIYSEKAAKERVEKKRIEVVIDEIQNSISRIEISLEKYLKDSESHDIDNVYYHIGVIKAAIQ